MTDPASRLRKARISAGYDHAGTFARAHNLSEPTYRAHESGLRNYKAGTARFYAELLSVDWNWLLFGEGESQAESGTRFPTDSFSIPAYDLRVSAGYGAVMGDNARAQEHLSFPKRWVRQRTQASVDQLVLLFVAGDSMLPTLSSGDQILVDMQHKRVTSPGIYVVRVNDQLLIKRAQPDPGDKLCLLSDNPQYPPLTGLEYEDVEICGRALWLGRDLL